jgi:hypothetical protein
MERVQVLIHKLATQEANKESPAQLLATVQLLYAELVKQSPVEMPATSKNVSVVMPVIHRLQPDDAPRIEPAAPADEPQPVIAEKPNEIPINELPAEPAIEKEEAPTDIKAEPYSLQKPAIESRPAATVGRMELPFDIPEDIPTLRNQPPVQKEWHELLGDKKESLNDRLKQEQKELGSSLTSEPIKDLRKGIGVNDKFLFISELFRGDEAMYERSIKTINSFHILPEAEYWINRELKVKLGWTDTRDTVQHFYQVVRRRFS